MATKLTIIAMSLVVALLITKECQLQVAAEKFPGRAKPAAGVPRPTSQPRAPRPAAQPRLPMYGITEGSLQPQECSGRCTGRCSATRYKKPCMFFCKKCCGKCLCVPPGTYGNKQFCPCYNNWKTKRGGPKCP